MTRSLALVLAAALLAGCAPSTGPSASATSAAPSPTSSAAPSATAGSAAVRNAGWVSDLEAIMPALERIHPDPYHGTTSAIVAEAVEALTAAVPTLSDDELMVGVIRIMALISGEGREGHSSAFVWGAGTYATHTLPLRLWIFPEGLAIVDALPPYEDLVGTVIEAVDGLPIADVLAVLEPLMPRDNDETLTLLTPRFVLTTEILHGAGLIDDPSSVELTLQGEAGTIDVAAIPTADYNDWATPYGLHLPTRPDVPYLARSEEPIWTREDPDATLYVQYNRVTRLGGSALAPITTALGGAAVRRVIVDVRHNFGGETPGYLPIAAALVEGAPAWTRGLYVITGRNTFSAATLFAADLAAQTETTIVGEPMSGSPTLFANTLDVTLPYSGIAISVATQYYEIVPGDQRLDVPVDIPVSLTLADFLAGRDPALEAIEGVEG